MEIRKSILDNDGVLVAGEPLFGKTRSALEAIKAVCPEAHLFYFRNPETLNEENIAKIVIPCFFLEWRKPRVVIFLDDIPKFTGKANLIKSLYGQLRSQVSRIIVVATCREADLGAIRSELQLETPLKFPVYLRWNPNSEAADELFRGVWKGKTPPLVQDKTAPGKIVLGWEYMRETYRDLGEEYKRVITAIGLAARCGASRCEETFLWLIFGEVLKKKLRKPKELDMILNGLQEKGFVWRQSSEISVQHDSYLDEDYMAYYMSVSDFRGDLVKLEAILAKRIRSQNSGLVKRQELERLVYLGLYFQKWLRDLESGRRILEKVVALDPKDASHHLKLAGLYAWRGETDHAIHSLEACLELWHEPNKQAEALLLFADELLYALNRVHEAANHYERAYSLATNHTLRDRIAFHYADCLIKNGQYAEAELLYREGAWSGDEALLAGFRLFLAKVGQHKVNESRDLLQDLWRDKDSEAKIRTAVRIFDDAQGCFEAGAPQLETAYQIVFKEFRDSALQSDQAKNDLIAFASTMLIQGFLEPTLQAHKCILESSSIKLDLDHFEPMKITPAIATAHGNFELAPPDRVSLLINLGAAFRDLLKFDEARYVFKSAQQICGNSAELSERFDAAQAGIADCDLFEGGNISAVQTSYKKAQGAISKHIKFWGSIGLGDIYVLQGAYDKAEKAYKTLPWFPISFGGESRFALGLAEAYLGLGKFEDAGLYVHRGLRLPLRHCYAHRTKQLRELQAKIKQARDQFELTPTCSSDCPRCRAIQFTKS